MLYGHSLTIPLSHSCFRSLLLPFLFPTVCRDPLIHLHRDDSLLWWLSSSSIPFFFHSSSSSPELCALPVFSLLPCPVCVFMSLPCCPHALPSLTRIISLCRRYQSACLLCVPNHFALLMFQGAGTLTGDMEVHLTKHEQARRHRLHNTPVPPGWGLKPQQRGIIFFHKHCIMVHWCRVVASQFVDSHL